MEVISILLLHLLCIAAQEDWDDFSEFEGEPRPQLPQEETFISLSPAQLASKLLKLESEVNNLKEENLQIAALKIEVTNLKEQNLNMKTKGFRTCQELKTNSDIKTSGEYF